jgi:hypothetical protein
LTEWTEGEWNGDWPVEPPNWDFVWYIMDEKWSRVHVVPMDGLRMVLYTAVVYRRQDDPDADPPRWWWIGIEQPLHLPPESARGKRRIELAQKYADDHCITHDLLLPCEECPEPQRLEEAVDCGDCGYCVPCQSDPKKAYCKRHGLLGKTGDCQDCRDEEVYS